MYTTVYEINEHFFPYYIVIPLCLLIIFVLLYYYLKKYQIKNVLCVILPIATLFMLILCVASIYNFFDLRNNIVVPYFNGKYMSIEGIVENFEPIFPSGNGTESFEVDGIEFRYLKSFMEYIGYSKTSIDVGFIHKNGQKVRIRYIYDETYDVNIILRLEIAENDEYIRKE